MREDLVIFVWKNGIIELCFHYQDFHLSKIVPTPQQKNYLFHNKLYIACMKQIQELIHYPIFTIKFLCYVHINSENINEFCIF